MFVCGTFSIYIPPIDRVFNFPADIFEDANDKVKKLGLTVKCFGGGKIEHKPKRKEIKVFGYSSVSEKLRLIVVYQFCNNFGFSFLWSVDIWKGGS